MLSRIDRLSACTAFMGSGGSDDPTSVFEIPAPLAQLPGSPAKSAVRIHLQRSGRGSLFRPPESTLHLSLARLQPRSGGFLEATVEKPCQGKRPRQAEGLIGLWDALLSLSCSLGTQALAERFPDRPVLAALNMRAEGSDPAPPDWLERCLACGDCRLGNLGGIYRLSIWDCSIPDNNPYWCNSLLGR